MDLEEFFERMKKIQSLLLNFIENEYDEEENFDNLIKNIQYQNIVKDIHKMKIFLYIISQISNNHYRYQYFFNKIEKILKFFQKEIHHFYPNYELFKIFKENKRILIFLIEEKMIIVDKMIVQEMISLKYIDHFYPEYFSPEIKPFIEELKKELKYNKNIQAFYQKVQETSYEDFDLFNKKRRQGENDNFICKMILNDSIEEFITYVNKENYSLNNYIEKSIFETNPFLLKQKHITLIEYAVFFGSIQIFKYLYKNDVAFTDSLWQFAVHGKNEEIIHILEENNVNLININFEEEKDKESEDAEFDEDEDDELSNEISYEKCFIECVKYHHNGVANYIEQNYLKELKFDKFFLKYSFRFYNFLYLPKEWQNDQLFFYACKYDYFNIVDILLTNKKININSTYVFNISIFFIRLEFYFKYLHGIQ